MNATIQLYDFAAQTQKIGRMQEASLRRPDLGLAPEPLVGSDAWWEATDLGQLAIHDLEGTVPGNGGAAWPTGQSSN
jgi:hypothetical protein